MPGQIIHAIKLGHLLYQSKIPGSSFFVEDVDENGELYPVAERTIHSLHGLSYNNRELLASYQSNRTVDPQDKEEVFPFTCHELLVCGYICCILRTIFDALRDAYDIEPLSTSEDFRACDQYIRANFPQWKGTSIRFLNVRREEARLRRLEKAGIDPSRWQGTVS